METWPRKKPRTMRPNKIRSKWANLQASERKIDEAQLARARRLSSDPVEFFEKIVGFKPTEYQVDLIEKFMHNQFVAMRWSRQSGKSWICAALLLWLAFTVPGSWIGIVAPGWRQSKAVIRRITSFLRNLPKGTLATPNPGRTVLHFSNGSIIESFPNNDQTIRGPSLSCIYWDESNHTPNDIDLWTAILFTISTTEGKVLVSSTPWNTDSIFYKIFHSEEYSDFVRSHVTWQQAMKPNGPLSQATLEKLRKQFGDDPWRWKREMEAEWAEDESVWLPQSLITKCIATVKTLGREIDLWDFEEVHRGSTLYAGVDLGKVGDYGVVVVVEKIDEKEVLRHLKIFPLDTSYASIIGYVKILQDRWGGFSKIRVDATNQSYVVDDMKNSDIDNVEAVHFTHQRKQEMATLLKQRMVENKFWFPYFTWEKPYRSEFVTELNVERFQLRKDGSIDYNHPQGTHDDVFWAVTLAMYATVEMQPEPFVQVVAA